ncbi:hypothetical protein C8R45DRAFT_1081513 [Mycena sanguinolenta]|nr:hypothetical protein C8R45DRAFT_1081513 [Mycena sanguinolenta]
MQERMAREGEGGDVEPEERWTKQLHMIGRKDEDATKVRGTMDETWRNEGEWDGAGRKAMGRNRRGRSVGVDGYGTGMRGQGICRGKDNHARRKGEARARGARVRDGSGASTDAAWVYAGGPLDRSRERRRGASSSSARSGNIVREKNRGSRARACQREAMRKGKGAVQKDSSPTSAAHCEKNEASESGTAGKADLRDDTSDRAVRRTEASGEELEVQSMTEEEERRGGCGAAADAGVINRSFLPTFMSVFETPLCLVVESPSLWLRLHHVPGPGSVNSFCVPILDHVLSASKIFPLNFTLSNADHPSTWFIVPSAWFMIVSLDSVFLLQAGNITHVFAFAIFPSTFHASDPLPALFMFLALRGVNQAKPTMKYLRWDREWTNIGHHGPERMDVCDLIQRMSVPKRVNCVGQTGLLAAGVVAGLRRLW